MMTMMKLSRGTNILRAIVVPRRAFSVQVLDDAEAVTKFKILNNKSVLYFTASWCGPCRQIKPIYEDLSAKYQPDVAFGKVDVDENPDAAAEHHISAVPTFYFCQGEKVVHQFAGADPRQLQQAVENLKQM